MKTDSDDGGRGEPLDAAAPDMDEGREERAREGTAAAGPPAGRRRTIVAVIVLLSLAVLAVIGVVAGMTLFPIERSIHFSNVEEEGPRYVFGDYLGSLLTGDGELQGIRLPSPDTDLSPVSDEAVWELIHDQWPHREIDIIRGFLDGSGQVNLSAQVGLGGVNCIPRWSPDSTMIAFRHCDPEPDVRYPCQTGFQLWVMNADGFGAHPVTPEELPNIGAAHWSPDGTRLLTYVEPPMGGDLVEGYAITTDIGGTDVQELPNVGRDAIYSPDGSMIASCDLLEGELDGVPGAWRRLLLTKADGSDPKILVKQFLVEAELEAHYPTTEQQADFPDFDWLKDVRFWAGPKQPRWSPSGDKIAFLAAMPFDAAGISYRQQVEVWIYDLATDEIHQVTDDDIAQDWLAWK